MDLKDFSSNWKRLQASGTITDKRDNTTTGAKPQTGTLQERAGLKRKRNVPVEKIHKRIDQHSLSSKSKTIRIMSKSQGDTVQNGMRAGGRDHKIIQTTVSQGGGGSGTDSTNERVTSDRVNEGLAKNVDVGKYVAIDCEMVGVGPRPELESALARVSMVDYNGDQIYDSYVRPREEVTDWRTHVSGIQPKHMVYARSLEEVQTDVAALIKGRIVIGHSIRSDFDALFLDHPKRDVRDTARHPPYRRLAGGGSPKLKILASELLGLEIQVGEHSSVEDARATMLLFRRDKDSFEKEHIKKWGPLVMPTKSNKVESATTNGIGHEKSKKKKKKKKR